MGLVIQEMIDTTKVPIGSGRIPRKIETGFSGLTADQLKNWVNIYSIPCLHQFLNKEELECWRHFVLASRILSKRAITDSDITISDLLLLQFCKRMECLYGKQVITPNMHMHCHIKDVLLDYGPVYGFWLFSFECYNGILGSSNHCIEPQLMHRFLLDQSAYTLQYPEEFSGDFGHFLSETERLTGSVLLTISPSVSYKIPSRKYLDHALTKIFKQVISYFF